MDKLLKNYYNFGGKDVYKHLAMLDMDQRSLHDLAQDDEVASMYYNKLMELNTDQEFVQLLSNDDEYELYVESEISDAREDAKLEIAKAMLKKNMDINLIAEITNLPVEEIKTLK